MLTVSAVVLAAAVGAGCGSDEDGSTSRDVAGQPSVTVVTPTAAAAPPAPARQAPATVTGSSVPPAGDEGAAVTATGAPAVCVGVADTAKCDLRP